MKVGYIRVSTADQNTARQEEMLKDCGIERWYVDHASGKNTARPEFQKMMAYLREGDVLYICSYDRLGRSMKDMLEIMEELNNRQVEIVSLKEQLDTSTPQGRFILNVLFSFGQMEREIIHERTMEGVRIAKEAGKFRGRRPMELPSDYHLIMNQWCRGEILAATAMRYLKLNSTTFYRKAKEFGYRREDEHSAL